MSEKKTTGGRLMKTGWNMNRHRDGFQGVTCRAITSRGSGNGVRVWILEVEEARRRGKMLSELLLPKPGGMCYRHNLAGPRGGPRASWI
jgi:hypothetical protein